jgi:uncharacterized membrane protein YuzA (DUF378 family)
MPQQPSYSIPLKFRKMENLHIVFWLLKDISWCMVWKPLGIIMVVPTLAVAIWIVFKNKTFVSEVCHNLAIVFWISANSFWMLSEFFEFDETKILFGLTGKETAIIPFLLGLCCLIYYYAIWKPFHKNAEEPL